MYKKLLPGILSLLLFFSCTKAKEYARPDVNIIPAPQQMTNEKGVFIIDNNTPIVFNSDDPQVERSLSVFKDNLKNKYNLDLKIQKGDNKAKSIFFELDPKSDLGKEAYRLYTTPEGIRVVASHYNGLFLATETIEQIISTPEKNIVIVPSLTIKDEPRFGWRGAHFDVGRHFFNVAEVKKFIDYLAMYKMNIFHWHLTEDQGWRIEIKKYPNLTKIGSKREETVIGRPNGENTKFDGKPYGGFYTQDEIKEVVQYAKDRAITVVPEIELPGHALAALASYPEYGCTGGPYKVGTNWGVYDDVYCAGNDKTFEFIQNIIDEVVPLFPSKYFHIGGDECPKTQWKKCPKCQARIKAEGLKNEHELQSYFVHRIEKYLNSKGKSMIGWDEILEGGLAPNATVMSWRGEKGGIEAAKQNHDVVMTPGETCYFDHYQGKPEKEPLAIGGFLPLNKVYNYEPLPKELNSNQQKHILGVQANVWTEYMPNFKQVEYMLLPRIAAMSEVAWSPQKAKNYDNFKKRLLTQEKIYKNMNINYCTNEFKN